MKEKKAKPEVSGQKLMQHYFRVPDIDSLPEDSPLKEYFSGQKKRKKSHKKDKRMRYVAYVRVSSEEQVGNFSIDAQKRAIRTWVAAQDGVLMNVYVDEGHTGRTSQRPGFQQMRKDARKGKFDALVVHKFDRFARNRTDALAIKSLLRYDYGIKVFSATEPSEDSDGPIGALIEGIMESVADWYSRNLAAETSKGKSERSKQGYHNNRAPFGMKKNKKKVLIPHPDELPGLQLAFEAYASDKYSDTEVARLLNERGYKSKTGRPLSKDTIRDMLQNQTYLGKVKYQKYQRNSDGSRSYAAPIEWLDGQHEAVIDQEIFDRCKEVRASRAKHYQATKRYNAYLLRDLIYCYRYSSDVPEGPTFRNYGKMRPQAQSKDNHYRYYRCRARELGYDCEQGGVQVETLDEQVVNILMQLKPPEEWRKGVTKAMGELLGEQSIEERLGEIREKIKRMDFRWDHGFITDEVDFMEKRLVLQHELEQFTPIPEDDLERAADILENFKKHWEACGEDAEAQHRLVKLIVKRVYVLDKEIVAVTLRSDYHVVLGHKLNGPTEMSVDPLYTHGSDGIRIILESLVIVWPVRDYSQFIQRNQRIA
ncbi:recombinase family protein [Chloroflexota bacterium]